MSWNSGVWYRFRYPDGAGYETTDVIRSDPYFRSVSRNECMAWKCAGTCQKSGKATISTAICTRDDIMIYLINKGVESALAFTIMESVRKGKGLKPEWEEAMKAQDVPDWYIWFLQEDQLHVPESSCGSLCYDGIPDRLL